MGLVRFLASAPGRWVRIAAGVLLIALGMFVVEGGWGIALMVIGIVPLWAGTTDHCVLGPMMKRGLRGDQLRRSLGMPAEAPLFPQRRVHA